MCLGNITAINMKKTGLNGYVYGFSIDYNIIDNIDIIDTHKYLIKKHDINNVWIY